MIKTKMAGEDENLPIQCITKDITKKLLYFIAIWFDEKLLKIYKFNYVERQPAMRSRNMSKLPEDPGLQEDHADLQIFRSSAGLSSKLLGLLGLHAEIQGLLHDIWFVEI